MKQSNIKLTGAYLRVASPCNFGILKQKNRVNQYLLEVGDTENATYFYDNGFSGCTSERPALQAMLKQVAEGTISKIVVVSIDRLARDYRLMGELLQVLNNHSVQVVSLDSRPEDNSILELLGVWL